MDGLFLSFRQAMYTPLKRGGHVLQPTNLVHFNLANAIGFCSMNGNALPTIKATSCFFSHKAAKRFDLRFGSSARPEIRDVNRDVLISTTCEGGSGEGGGGRGERGVGRGERGAGTGEGCRVSQIEMPLCMYD